MLTSVRDLSLRVQNLGNRIKQTIQSMQIGSGLKQLKKTFCLNNFFFYRLPVPVA